MQVPPAERTSPSAPRMILGRCRHTVRLSPRLMVASECPIRLTSSHFHSFCLARKKLADGVVLLTLFGSVRKKSICVCETYTSCLPSCLPSCLLVFLCVATARPRARKCAPLLKRQYNLARNQNLSSPFPPPGVGSALLRLDSTISWTLRSVNRPGSRQAVRFGLVERARTYT